MDPIILGAGASFIAGAAGYVIVRYWVGPIRAYGRAKAGLAAALRQLDEGCGDGEPDLKAKSVRRRMKAVRQQANALLDCYQIELPVWYRLKLRSAGQDPEMAVPPLLSLHQLPTAAQVNERMESARRQLQL
ncbi:MAG: hypothetical protein QNJ22_01820 [Desulfosarcinaceae bacterium]|nr:hypothetical protein [Desulfosarcinaceae bacterium]